MSIKLERDIMHRTEEAKQGASQKPGGEWPALKIATAFKQAHNHG